MTRIVSGSARGRRLAVPPRGTRPTSDRAREALFNTLATELDLDRARVLDLFAGSGAVGLEALSRGAAAAVFVESDHRAAGVLADNIRTLALPGARLNRCTVETYLAALGADEPFDLVFADPPYTLAQSAVTRMLACLAQDRWLVPGGLVVVERASRDPEPEWPSEIKAIKQRRYGEGSLWYGRRE
ncbi:16S rRNA (guanine(966)-N(2))-methyltransferase RsmD [Jatrophihabitans telluris]|uniref:16S rRNA (Guanine(966)-N(2))-methyltransferase RsmD n=1 Tax=Jatrophihabitans telluris TaxID=2038343 RepID=A0ABY4R218_9ACTN|nr:16S rRNA (guanine(966)-N(2))-methyltransferase RsmD [Jatrophihabitans telluris]UQX89966.1 16S rRNA (guanine(966)-N(2))-methyltransferase RsmD [Jatrophihabitans telluris]